MAGLALEQAEPPQYEYEYNSGDDLLLMAPKPLDGARWEAGRSDSLRDEAQLLGRPSAPTPMKLSGAGEQIGASKKKSYTILLSIKRVHLSGCILLT
eukprot:scaffold63490_cov19-Prasinocladus_malaysianus.AAC.2